jgi:excisionase family DNA binding protein
VADWLTLSDVAKYLRLPASTVYKLKASGKIRGYRVGRNLRFDRAEVDADVRHTRSKKKSPRKVGAKK